MEVFIVVAIVGLAYWLATSGGGSLGSVLSGGSVGSTLTASQIQGYAANAGFSGDDLNTAVAVALAESSGRTGVVGDTSITPGGSIGLWQINLQAHPEYTAAELTDPQTNANAAYAIYSAAGGQFTPWTTFNTGAYMQYLQSPAQAPADDSTVASVSSYDDSGDEDYS